MKRKAESSASRSASNKRRPKASLTPEEAKKRFRKNLFDKSVLDSYTSQYAKSAPYKHAVIESLVDDSLLRSVRNEIRDNVHFTPKETDIYRIHQSGDLANLDGLDDDALSKLPSLLALRDAVYSRTFRDYVSHVTGCGPLSGRKTDMAINVYTPGCFLLCHDDVIGSRKVSYILYLTDPDVPWKAEWGGALRLFPTEEIPNAEDGTVAKTPLPDAAKVIPPAWNQLSFFAVQPGESFHDVEEVYHPDDPANLEREGGRVRMAISGWFHIPQIGEDGYKEGAEDELARNSGLMQLQGNPDQYDRPAPRPTAAAADKGRDAASAEETFDAADLEFLLKYIAPTYLVPDTLEAIAEHFDETSGITLSNILTPKFAARLRSYVEAQEKADLPSGGSPAIEAATSWKVARPPHKHRYLYMQPAGPGELRTSREESPVTELLDVFLPSRQFRRWLSLATGCTVESSDLLARRFRRGLDYTLATGHEGKPRLELNLGFTPTTGWGDQEEEEEEEEEEEDQIPASKPNGKGKGKDKGKGKGKEKAAAAPAPPPEKAPEKEVGGHEIYMATDEDDDGDAAVYKASSGDADDNILFFQAAAWNKLTIVLRDSGALRFVGYVSKSAAGDRWDISGVYDVEEEDGKGNAEGGDEDEEEDDDDEEEFNGFSDSPGSESD
ncbi:related to component of NuA3 histone acetyltransferase complex [Cephalotrichum gorgonifer]|uniref:uS12 prolyl 3,4-dihydroxylase n=1 Tax=Cephalotrichum gorgonifer TaxID=2041049 RepID=A0AAE8MQQ8_9PEZI|nr:related to component of NuA3 histone acetyltransferase complex [Cephalotrichum gorgonifer]